jgi:Cft2 family RNA processing exonuclease
LRITWKNGILIENGSTKVFFDLQNSRLKTFPAFVSHGHLDHLAAFKNDTISKYSSKETFQIASSYGFNVKNWSQINFNKEVKMDNITVIPHNSGHVLGSYEYEVITPEGTILFTGDFNTEWTKTMKPAEPRKCDILIIESTFGLPNFVFPNEDIVGRDMINWAKNIITSGKIPTFQTDPLGNAQEIIGIFNEIEIPVLTHWKVSRINKIYTDNGYKLEFFDIKSTEAKEIIQSGNFVYITPKQLNLQDYPEYITALVSGWALWAKRIAFPLSDHADFPHLIKFIEDCSPQLVLTCHGSRNNSVLINYIEKKLGIRAYPIKLIPTSLNPFN